MTGPVKFHKAEDPKITLTVAARDRLLAFLAKSPKAVGVRFSVDTTGCSGLAYVLDLIDTVNAEDKHLTMPEGIEFYISVDALPYVQGTEIDYIKDGLNEHFIYKNPNEKGRCGCGESFTV